MDNHNKVQLKDHLDFQDEVINIIHGNQYVELMKYTNFALCNLMCHHLVGRLFENKNATVIKYVIDNMYCRAIDDEYELIHHLIYHNTDINLIKYVFEKYHLDLEINTHRRSKPIHIACACRSLKVIKLLIKNGVNIESENNDKTRPIHFSCQRKNYCHQQQLYDDDNLSVKIIKFLISCGVDLESKDIHGDTPLHFACRFESIKIIDFLVECGVNLEVTNNNRWKPIHIACRYGSIEKIKYMLSKNVNLDSRVNEPKGEYDIIDLLMKRDNLTPENKTELIDIISKKIESVTVNDIN